MPRFRMTVEYDGSAYVGWQRQENGHSIQAALEQAILSLTSETVVIRGAGRTDSGVHAMGQVIHADLSRAWEPHKLRNALNAHLAMASEQVAVLDVQAVSDEFDARFSALRRHYLYASSPGLRVLRWRRSGPGGSRSRSITTPCTRPPSSSWVTTTSPPSAPPIAKRKARFARWIGWMSRAQVI